MPPYLRSELQAWPTACPNRRSRGRRSLKRPTPATILRLWLSFGIQSFGGGNATLALIRRSVVEQNGWLTDAEFVSYWALCQITPGINLLALTILLGRRFGGARGIALAMIGLLAPSGAITVLLTALYRHFEGSRGVEALVRGVIPATLALGFVTAVNMGRPLLEESKREGRWSLATSVFLLLLAGIAEFLWPVPVIALLIACGLIAGVAKTLRRAGGEANEELAAT